jgi:hypothetical protein
MSLKRDKPSSLSRAQITDRLRVKKILNSAKNYPMGWCGRSKSRPRVSVAGARDSSSPMDRKVTCFVTRIENHENAIGDTHYDKSDTLDFLPSNRICAKRAPRQRNTNHVMKLWLAGSQGNSSETPADEVIRSCSHIDCIIKQ